MYIIEFICSISTLFWALHMKELRGTGVPRSI